MLFVTRPANTFPPDLALIRKRLLTTVLGFDVSHIRGRLLSINCRRYVSVEQRVHIVGPSYGGHVDMMVMMMMM